MRWNLMLERRTDNRLNVDITKRKLKNIASVAERNQSLGFTAKVGKLGEPEELDPTKNKEKYRYLVRLSISKESIRNQETVDEKYKHVLKMLTISANKYNWNVIEGQPSLLTDEEIDTADKKEETPRLLFVVPDLNEDVLNTFFGEIYEREPHIRIIHSAVNTCIESNGELLSHVLLHGLPGGCKTHLMEAFKDWYEVKEDEGTERVMSVDGTTMSKAGLENWLLELAGSGCLPEILVVDELEKQPSENLSCLNGAMGSGILAKLNARIGNKRESVKFMVVGICNDIDQLRGSNIGRSLYSRFTHKVYCERPSRELSYKILSECVKKLKGGSEAWVKEALTFAWDELGERDIREIKGHLDGRDRLLNGEWQNDVRKLVAAEKAGK